MDHEFPTGFDDEVRRAFVRPVDPALRAQHLQRMAHEHEQGERTEVLELPRRRTLPLGARVAGVAAAAVFLAGTAMAGTGLLPDAAQDRLADVAIGIGLDLPGGSNESTVSAEPIAERSPAQEGAALAAEEMQATRESTFAEARRAWGRCVRANREAHDGAGRFDPEDACGREPSPVAFGLVDEPEPTREPVVVATAQPEPEPTPEPTAEPTPEPTEPPSPSPTATATVSPQPTSDTTSE